MDSILVRHADKLGEDGEEDGDGGMVAVGRVGEVHDWAPIHRFRC